MIKNNKNIYSFRDAQGFRKDQNQKLKVVSIDASVYHYGWVKPPASMQAKQRTFQKLWHNDEWVAQHVADSSEFDYTGKDELEKFKGDHPLVMRERIAKYNWNFERDISQNKKTIKEKIKSWISTYLGLDFTYKINICLTKNINTYFCSLNCSNIKICSFMTLS